MRTQARGSSRRVLSRSERPAQASIRPQATVSTVALTATSTVLPSAWSKADEMLPTKFRRLTDSLTR